MINIIAAAAKNGVIGSKGRIPWSIPEDMEYFRRITCGGTVIMGRRTYEEIGRPLAGRYNIVVSRSKSFSGKGLASAKSLDEAIRLAQEHSRKNGGYEEIFLCGGGGIYREGIRIAHRVYLTELDSEYEGDVYFPELGVSFRLVSSERCEKAGLSFNIYERAEEI